MLEPDATGTTSRWAHTHMPTHMYIHMHTQEGETVCTAQLESDATATISRISNMGSHAKGAASQGAAALPQLQKQHGALSQLAAAHTQVCAWRVLCVCACACV